jgi:hypothetical protein
MTQANANSHTHCQVAQANAQTKTWQRVCLFQRTIDRQSECKPEGQPITGVWQNGGISSKLSFCTSINISAYLNICTSNPPLRQAPKRYASF